MFQHLNKMILQFRYCFKREATWKQFTVLIIGFIIRNNVRGITSIVSSLRLTPEQYPLLLHYFRSSGYSTSRLYEEWIDIARRETAFLRISERVVMLGDHIKISKEGKRMPDIQVLHQDSENSGKGEYIEGHTYAQVSAVIAHGDVKRSLPLITELQKSPPRKAGTNKPDGDTLVTQMVNLAGKAVNALPDEDKTILVLDAYFSKATAFLAADKVTDDDGNRRLEIVTRGRDDSVGFTMPGPRPKGKRGATPKYGNAIRLLKLFSDKSSFTHASLKLYGKPTKVAYRCLDLIWKPVKRMVRFVAVESERGKMLLMSSDLTLSPEDIITLYCLRFKIETSFDEQKNAMGSFAYHFWTTAIPKRKRWTKNDSAPPSEHPERVEAAKRATDSFVCLGTIATGIATIIAFSHNRQIWNRYPGWIRTRRSVVPSLVLTKEAIAYDFPAFLRIFPHLCISSIISERIRSDEFLYVDAV